MVEDPSQRGSGVLVDFGSTAGIQTSLPQRLTAAVSFDRDELRTILNLYGRKVAAGEWRDYAIDTLKDRAVFSVFRRASEMPIYRIEKNPLSWLDEILNGMEHTNFFENRATEYSKASTEGSWEEAFEDKVFQTA